MARWSVAAVLSVIVSVLLFLLSFGWNTIFCIEYFFPNVHLLENVIQPHLPAFIQQQNDTLQVCVWYWRTQQYSVDMVFGAVESIIGGLVLALINAIIVYRKFGDVLPPLVFLSCIQFCYTAAWSGYMLAEVCLVPLLISNLAPFWTLACHLDCHPISNSTQLMVYGLQGIPVCESNWRQASVVLWMVPSLLQLASGYFTGLSYYLYFKEH